MRLTIPKVATPRSTKKGDLIYRIIEICWHTVIPVAGTYLMMRYDLITMIIPILTVMIVRLDNIERKN
jgi:hypothetical protein